MQVYPSGAALILVAILPSARDLEIARLFGWYRMPLKSAPKVVDVDYLAFYQTAAFGEEHRWQVEYVAEVTGHELTTRRELFKDEPNHPRANEEYFKIQIGALQPLPQPIPAESWRRLTFLYTTGELLKRARCLNDLVVRADERQGLWRNLRERAMRAGEYHASDLPEQAIDPAILWLLEGLKGEQG